MSILNLKIKRNVVYFSAMFFELQARFFGAIDIFPGTFIDCRSMMFTQILMKELACMLIHELKVFSCRVFFEMLMSMCLVNCRERTLQRLINFENATFEKITSQ